MMDSEEQEILIAASPDFLAEIRVFPIICYLNKDVTVSKRAHNDSCVGNSILMCTKKNQENIGAVYSTVS